MSQFRTPLFTIIVLSICFGFLSGILGMLFFSLSEPSFFSSGASTLLFQRGSAPAKGVGSIDSETILSASRASVLFFPKKSEGTGIFSRAFLSKDAIGSGFTLTSDGWLLTESSVFSGKNKKSSDIVAVIGNRIYPLKEILHDDYADVMFVKVDATNLPVISFGNSEDLVPTETVFAFDVLGNIERLSVTMLDNRGVNNFDELLTSSERAQKVLHLSENSAVLSGAMVFTTKGEVVGIFEKGGIAMPFERFSTVIGNVLKEKKPTRPFFGVHYLDLSKFLRLESSDLPTRGALLTSSVDGKISAVIKQSPADIAGLKENDIITSVNGEELTSKNSLADLLAEYNPGSTVTLSVIRHAEEQKIDVVLGSRD